MSLLLVIWGTISSELGGVGDTVEVWGEVARVRLGSDWPRLEYAGTWTLSVFGVGDLLSRLRLKPVAKLNSRSLAMLMPKNFYIPKLLKFTHAKRKVSKLLTCNVPRVHFILVILLKNQTVLIG